MRTLVRGTDPRAVCQEVVDRGLHPAEVDVDLGDGRILPLVLDDPAHFTLYIRLYSRALAARNLFLSGNVRRALWEIGAALIAADEPPCFLEQVYLAEISNALANAESALRTGQTSGKYHGPYASMTIAENLCLTRLFLRQAHPALGPDGVVAVAPTVEDISPDVLGPGAGKPGPGRAGTPAELVV